MIMYRHVFISLALMVILTAFSTSRADCQQQDPASGLNSNKREHILVRIGNALDGMRYMKVKEGDTEIPLPVRPLLTDLKHGLRDLILATLNDGSAPWAEPEEAQARVLSMLRQNLALIENPEMNENDAKFAYGEIVDIHIARPPEHADILVATTTLSVMCGSDTSLYLFRREAGLWRLVAEQEANGYEEILEAQGSFEYAISQPDAEGRVFVVTTDVNPWCTSNWQGLRYRAFRVTADPHHPDILLQGNTGIYLGKESDGVISASPDGFRIEFDARQSLDSGILVRKHILAYKLAGGKFVRVPPFSDSPEGFIDEWFDLPWEEAAQWVSPSASPQLRDLHERMKSRYSEEEPQFSTEFAHNPPACILEQGRWQVDIDFIPDNEDSPLPPGVPETACFNMILKDGAYFLEAVPESGEPKCSRQNAEGEQTAQPSQR